MSATLTLQDRPGPVTIRDEGVVRAVAGAVTLFSRGGGDTQLRIRRPSPSRHVRRAVVFSASEVVAINADGVDLTDFASPVAYSAHLERVAEVTR